MDRRTLIKGAAWSVPVIAMAVAAPAAVASQEPPSRIEFTNATATVGKHANTIYVNTKVQVKDGPASVRNVRLTVAVSRDGATVVQDFPEVAGWGSTGQVYIQFPRIPKGHVVAVTFTATADGVAPITATVPVTTPDWWS